MKVQGKEKLKILILGNCFSNKGTDYILAVFGNITEIRSAEDNLRALAQELSKQNEDLKRFAYITSHDLRAPVINLNALLEYYDYEDPSSEINKELIVKFKQSAERISDTLNDLLEVTRIKDRTQSEIKDMCSISKIFYNCIQDNAEQIKKVEGTVTADFSQKDSIYFTKSVLNSTFTNLITNAIKYRSSERNLEITVTTETIGTNYIIRFTDNGLGMNTEKIKNRLFTLYQRFHSHVEGKGLGLYLVKSQLEALGGSLAVESEENKGTTFVISIPIQNPKKALN
jgi:signal transduction histidine kinase